MSVQYIEVPADHAGFHAAKFLAAGSGCIKAPVGAAIFDNDLGLLGAGNNDVVYPPRTCPRVVDGYATGEGYQLCKDYCGQNLHAEVAAILHAQKCVPASLISGSTLFLWGHTYCCEHCVELLNEAGITTVALPVDKAGDNPSIEAWA